MVLYTEEVKEKKNTITIVGFHDQEICNVVMNMRSRHLEYRMI